MSKENNDQQEGYLMMKNIPDKKLNDFFYCLHEYLLNWIENEDTIHSGGIPEDMIDGLREDQSNLEAEIIAYIRLLENRLYE